MYIISVNILSKTIDKMIEMAEAGDEKCILNVYLYPKHHLFHFARLDLNIPSYAVLSLLCDLSVTIAKSTSFAGLKYQSTRFGKLGLSHKEKNAGKHYNSVLQNSQRSSRGKSTVESHPTLLLNLSEN